MAHEIKNPLNSIGLIVDYLGDRFRPVNERDQMKFGELSANIKTELARLNDIVERFLRFAKPAIASKRPIDVTRLVDETLDFILQRRSAKAFICELILIKECQRLREIIRSCDRLC